MGSVLLLSGCTPSHFATPTSAGPRVITVVAGDTGDPVAGASVRVAGQVLSTDGAGRVIVEGLPPAGDVDLAAKDFLPRQTRIGSRDDSLTLWPVRTASSVYVRDIVYSASQTTREHATGSVEPLMRIVASRVSLVASAEILGDRRARAAHESAVDEINAAMQGRVFFSLDETPGAGVVFRLSLDATAANGALTYRDLRNEAIVGGRVLYGELAVARDLRYVVHELGHVVGLQHSTVASDMMYFVALASSPVHFTPNEITTIGMLLQRRAGTVYPDNDRSASASANATRTSLIVN